MGGCCCRPLRNATLPPVTAADVGLTGAAGGANAAAANWHAAVHPHFDADFRPNFGWYNDVLLTGAGAASDAQPLTVERVANALCASARAEAVVRLSSLCVQFTPHTATAAAAAAAAVAPADAKGNGGGEGGGEGDGAALALARVGGCAFSFVERVPVLCGITTDVPIHVRQRYDASALLRDGNSDGNGNGNTNASAAAANAEVTLSYESVNGDGSIHIRKRRVITAAPAPAPADAKAAAPAAAAGGGSGGGGSGGVMM